MPLSTAAIAGIIITILALLSIAFAVILYTNRRHWQITKGLDDESPSMEPEGSASPSMPRPFLVEPKKRLNNSNHHRYPSMQHGPEPTITKKSRGKLGKYKPSAPGPNAFIPTPTAKIVVTSTPTPSSIAPTHTTTSATATVLHHTVRPGSSNTHRPSSLHQAVLGKQEEAMKEASEKMKAVGENMEAEANIGLMRADGIDAKPRRYTGAWP